MFVQLTIIFMSSLCLTMGQLFSNPECQKIHVVHFQLSNFSVSGGNCDATYSKDYEQCDLWVRANISGPNITGEGIFVDNGENSHVMDPTIYTNFTSLYDADRENITLVVQFADEAENYFTTVYAKQKGLQDLQKMETDISKGPGEFRCVWQMMHTHPASNWKAHRVFTEQANTTHRICNGTISTSDPGILITYTFSLQIIREDCMMTTSMTTAVASIDPSNFSGTGPPAKKNIAATSNSVTHRADDPIFNATSVAMILILAVFVVLGVILILGIIWNNQFFKLIQRQTTTTK